MENVKCGVFMDKKGHARIFFQFNLCSHVPDCPVEIKGVLIIVVGSKVDLVFFIKNIYFSIILEEVFL